MHWWENSSLWERAKLKESIPCYILLESNLIATQTKKTNFIPAKI